MVVLVVLVVVVGRKIHQELPPLEDLEILLQLHPHKVLMVGVEHVLVQVIIMQVVVVEQLLLDKADKLEEMVEQDHQFLLLALQHIMPEVVVVQELQGIQLELVD
jgi:hypothetical protein